MLPEEIYLGQIHIFYLIRLPEYFTCDNDKNLSDNIKFYLVILPEEIYLGQIHIFYLIGFPEYFTCDNDKNLPDNINFYLVMLPEKFTQVK